MNVFRSSSSSSTQGANKGDTGPLFATYLLPSLKIPFFRRRQSSATIVSIASSAAASNDVPSLSTSPTSPTSLTSIDHLPCETYSIHLDHDKPLSQPPRQPPRTRRNSDRGRLSRTFPDVLRCTTCGTDLAYGLQVVSKGFTGRHGRALLVSAPLPSSTPSCPGPPLAAAASSTAAPAPNPTSYTSLARDGANLVNVSVGSPEKRSLVTGIHVVADITCATCAVKIGWKYVDAREHAQKYKVGKFILETERVSLHRSWEDLQQDHPAASRATPHFYSSSAPAGSLTSPAARRASALDGDGAAPKVSCSSEEAGGLGDGRSSPAQSDGEVMFDSDDEDECEDIFAGTWDAATVARRRGSRVSGGYSNAAKKGGGRR
ncbi:hypothetical protein KVR01_001428 [Diaporthe batatas]|uniref:uncharacterized protein n=1 Tax=Diaporthe batatas TaxID=748121 RepID=UPI001D04B685|nr:uncharacterized protein KVR01_001428 [Diaporthe batatas]KAG8168679.1 hypothetical protein KVR01_001428 [Diaporthe batatas]